MSVVAPPPVPRELGPDDWRDWRELRLRSLSEDPDAFASSAVAWTGPLDTEARWRERLSAPGACFVTYVDGVPGGMVGASPEADGSVQLVSMWVAPHARRRRVGEGLVAAVLAWAGERPVWLRAIDGNEPALALYERCGFRHDGAAPDAEGCVTLRR